MPRKGKKSQIKDLFGKKNDSVKTPKEIYDELERIFGKFFDPCPFVRPEWDGLSISWKLNNYVNPPFSEIKKWMVKAIEESKLGKQSVFLVTARVSSKYWFDLVWPFAKNIWFLEGATQFEGYENKLPIPLCVILFGPCSLQDSSLGEVKRFNDTKRWIRIR